MDQDATNVMQLTPYHAQATIVALHNYMQTLAQLKAIQFRSRLVMHALCIIE